MVQKRIEVKKLANDTAVVGRYLGGVLRKMTVEALSQVDEVVVDFDGIEMLTQSSADEFVSRIMREDESMIDKIHFKHCMPRVKQMIQWAVDNADSVLQHQNAFQV